MAKRSIGIDISRHHIHAVQLLHHGNRIQVENIAHAPLSERDEQCTEDIKHLLHKHKFSQHAAIGMNLPDNQVYYWSTAAQEQQPISDLKCINIPDTQLTDSLQHSRKDNNSQDRITLAVSKTGLKQQTENLKDIPFTCRRLDTSAQALITAVQHHYPELTQQQTLLVYTDPTRIILIVLDHTRILQIRVLSDTHVSQASPKSNPESSINLIQEIQLTWRSAFGNKIPESTCLILAGTINYNRVLIDMIEQTMSCKTQLIDNTNQIEWPTLSDRPAEFILAEGLALRVLEPRPQSDINFLNHDQKQKQHQSSLKQQFMLTMTLLALITLCSLIHLFMKKAALEKQNLQLEQQTADLFLRILPDEPHIVDAVTQIEQHIQQFQRNSADSDSLSLSGIHPLNGLQFLAENTPKELNLNISSISIAGPVLDVKASCTRRQQQYQWKQYLEFIPQVDSVTIEVLDTKQDDQSIQFNAQIIIKTENEL